MIADIAITEKSFGPKALMHDVRFSLDAGEKIGIVGRNGIGKSTLFAMLTGSDTDFSGDIIFRRGTVVVSSAQEHHNLGEKTTLQYILQGLPEYEALSHIIETYPETMGDDLQKITEYSDALGRFDDKGFYTIEAEIERELENFQLHNIAHSAMKNLSGGQKRLVEIVKIMHADAQLALIDEPTNHMDFVAKEQFVSWLKTAREAMLIITHDRDVLKHVDRIIELKDGTTQSFKGNYDAYLKQNAVSTGSAMNEFELIERRMANLKVKILDYQRLKEKSRNPGTIQKFKRLELTSRAELAELEKKEKPTFWIDKNSVENMDYKSSARYEKFKSKNIKVNMRNEESRSKHVLISAKNVALGYDEVPLFEAIHVDLREGEKMEFRGRNGAGKSTLIKKILDQNAKDIVQFSGEITRDSHMKIGVYEQEISQDLFALSLSDAIEKIYLDQALSISVTKIRKLASDYLFTEGDLLVPVERLSGGQKARLQLIKMLSNDPQLLILDEPTNHLDLPSIEELETSLERYSGAIIYVSHDGYFRDTLGGEIVRIGTQ